MTPQEKAAAIAKTLIDRVQGHPDRSIAVTWRPCFVSLHTHDRFTKRRVDLFTEHDPSVDETPPTHVSLSSSIEVMHGPYLDDLEESEVEGIEEAVETALSMFERLLTIERTADAALSMVDHQQRIIYGLRAKLALPAPEGDCA